MFGLRLLTTSVVVILMTRPSFSKEMMKNNQRQSVSGAAEYLGTRVESTGTTTTSLSRDKRSIAFVTAASSPTKINLAVTQKSENLISHANGTTSSMMASEEMAASTTRDTIVVLITLTIIFITLIASYFLWRKHRSNMSASHSVYMYSRLSQNDVEVDNISFQGDLTHKSLINAVPVCAEEDSCDDDQVRPATLCLEYDSLVTISNEDNRGDNGKQRKRSTSSLRRNSTGGGDEPPVNLLIDELSDEDLLQ